MIYESYPWKQDLYQRKRQIIKNNTAENFSKNEDKAYTNIEKAIFYSAFIIRKLIDCGGKMSDAADKYSFEVHAIKPHKQITRMSCTPNEDSHDWENERNVTVQGKFICNSLIHSFVFSVLINEEGTVDSFLVSSDFDKNKVLYRVDLSEWIKYIDFIASDSVVRLESHYDEKSNDWIYTCKMRGN